MAADLMTAPTVPAATTAFIRIRDVHKSYGAVSVLNGISIDVAQGEVLVLCGPSGCGKSTLLRCINGLETIQRGGISVGGRNVETANADTLQQIRLSTGFVFQNFNLFPHMTALDNITIAPMKILGVSQREAVEQGRALLEQVGMQEKADVYPFQLSGGQRQRVAIARALAMKPSLMLFDEPTSALDPEMREEVLQVIRKVHHEHNMTMVVVTHEIGFAKSVASRAMLLDAGRIVEEAPARRFFENPTEERTRRFLRAIIND
ncbi:amino acid ABC transporter ATP-binding protein, PAAT family [Bosea lathyri]|jgi:ABC-type polar amino acid transport system ATPase subunit|uniref:Amino acid ABC transporter ATP-binding protein, PAAT family n=2 Tax=Bosea lathyri TaxID=1036778 RepID=A0A1H6BIY8_9HYPH|nr:amino acid ABC transporter ATP-binding protein, PAAT family [Bosea lathyri]